MITERVPEQMDAVETLAVAAMSQQVGDFEFAAIIATMSGEEVSRLKREMDRLELMEMFD